MILLTILKLALTPSSDGSTVADDLMDEPAADAVEGTPNDDERREDVLAWFSLSLDRRALGRSNDELAWLGLTTTEADAAANPDPERWM